ncbi:MAG: hypothetical protein H0T51_26090 [Pirellulales bacterium]|nr:hypothetical protein [Pirellulales bacterium]
MKTERRHELEANTLAKGINTWGEKARPYTSAFLLAAAALLGVYIIASLWNSYQATRDRAAWDDYQLAVFQGDVEQRALHRLAVSEDHEGTEMQEWAMVGWADRQLLRASQLYLTSREEAIERLTEISGIYEQFAETASNPEIRNRARLGLARVSEMKNDLKEARAQYARVEGALSDIAAQRIKDLEPKQVEETAAWLATVTLPKPTPPTGPGTPGARPGFEATAPSTEGAEATLQDILGSLEPTDDTARYGDAAKSDAGKTPAATETPAVTEPAADAPAEPAATTPAEAPAAAEPAVETPAAAETPAAEEPVEQPAADAGATAEQ